MFKESFFIQKINIVVDFFIKLYLSSGFYTVYKAISKFLKEKIDNSFIMNLFNSNWDNNVGIKNSTLIISINKLFDFFGGKIRNAENGFCKAINESFLISFANQKMLMFLIYVIFFMLPFLPTMLLVFMCLLAILIFILNVFVGKICFKLNSFFELLLLFFGLTYILSSATSYNFPKSLEVMGVFIVFMLMAFVVINSVNTEERLNRLVNIFIVSAFLVSLYGIYQYFTGAEMDAAWVDASSFSEIKTRVYSTFGNPNVLGEYLILMASLCVGMLWKEKRYLFKFYYLFMFGVLALCLLFTNSRGSMLGLILSAGLFVLLAEKRLIVIGLFGLLVLPFVIPQSLLNRLMSVTTMQDSSSLYRISIYKASFNMLKDYWVSGIGVEAFNEIYPIYSFEAANAYHSHNLYLQEFIELGVVGFTAFIVMLILFFQKLYFGIRRAEKKYKYIIATVFGGFAGILLQGLADYIWFNYSIVLLFWLIIGLGIAMVNLGVNALDEK